MATEGKKKTRGGSSTKSAARSSSARKSPAKRTAAAKSAGRKYSPGASEYVEEEMKEMKQGKLKSGNSGKKVRNPKQAIAIGLSEARRAGEKVPPPRRKKAA